MGTDSTTQQALGIPNQQTPPTIVLTLSPETVDESRWDSPVYVTASNSLELFDAPTVPFDEFSSDPRATVDPYETLVFVGLTDFMTPSSRNDDVWEYVYNQIDIPCVSIDRFLFKSDPWRAWFQFGFVGAEYRDYTYSYLAETDYGKYFDGRTDDDPFSLDELQQWGDGIIESHYTDYFRQFDVEVGHEASAAEEYEYSELLDELFKTQNTMGQVRRGLESYCDDIYPGREMPKRHQLFRGDREWTISRTDLPIDTWKASRLQHLVDLTNGTLEAFR